MPAVTVPFSLDSERHRHILDWIGEQENVSASVRTVLDAHVRGQVTLVDVHHELVSLREQVNALRAHGSYVEVEGEGELPVSAAESPEVADALDRLGVD